MSKGQQTRRLAAIVVADVVGYSRLMEADESGTFDRLKAIRKDLVEPRTAEFGGRIVKGTGDGWLAEFPSATDAVRSSLLIQKSMAKRNARVAPERRLDIRVGVNSGEVILDGDDVFGTGVNVAARLEAISEPGGVCVSEAVYQQIRGVLDVRFTDMGTQRVKNIAEGVHAYAVHGSEGNSDTVSFGVRRDVAVGASIAVLPFDNFSGDPAQDYFVDGMVEEILTALARFKWLIVAARASTFAYKGRAVDVRRFAADLGVRYVLEGSVQKAGARIRINGQLIDALTGYHLWAERFEGELSDVFELQDCLTSQVVSSLEPQIRRAEIDRARHKRPESLDAYDLFLRALPKAYAMAPSGNSEAYDLLARALSIDPNYAVAAAFAAWCLEQRITRRWPGAAEDDAAEAVRLARLAIAADTEDSTVESLSGFVILMIGREYSTGMAALNRAASLNPNNPFALMNLGWAHVFAGDIDLALANLERAGPLSRHDPSRYFVLTGLAAANLFSGREEEAVRFAEKSLAVNEDWDATYFFLSMALARSGQADEAAGAVAQLQRLLPDASIPVYRRMLPIRDPRRLDLLEVMMREAGIPE